MTNPDDLRYLSMEELRPAQPPAGPSASQRAADVTHATAVRVRDGSRTAWDVTTSIATTLIGTTQGILSLRLSEGLNELLQDMVNRSASIYDGAIDTGDIASQAGSGATLRPFDGGHTILEAARATGGASPEDSIVREALGTVQGLFRGATPIGGLPFANWDGATFDRVAGALESAFHIPKRWFYDLSTYDAAELLGGAIGAVALTFSWNRAQTETFARLVGGLGLSAVVSANPLLLIVTVVALAKAFHKANMTGEHAELVDGQLRGGVGAGATLSAVALVGAAGGPAGAAVLAGLTAGILANRMARRVSVAQISRFLAGKTTVVAAEARAMIAQQRVDSSEKYVFLQTGGQPHPASPARGTAGPQPRSRSYSSRPPRSQPTTRTRPGPRPLPRAWR